MASPAVSAKIAAGHKLLLVDDDPMLRQLGGAFLERRGYHVSLAENGLDAIRVMKEWVPELVISDLRMPRMSGFEFLSIVRRRFPTLPLIAISGEFASQSEVMGIADVFFAKGSYTPEMLFGKIDELLANPLVRQTLHDPPIWVPVTPAGEVVLTCTDCLRSFPVRACPPEYGNPLRETECIACGTRLRYCIDQTGWESNTECFIRIKPNGTT
jgi:CheY-like chemotaxis protein